MYVNTFFSTVPSVLFIIQLPLLKITNKTPEWQHILQYTQLCLHFRSKTVGDIWTNSNVYVYALFYKTIKPCHILFIVEIYIYIYINFNNKYILLNACLVVNCLKTLNAGRSTTKQICHVFNTNDYNNIIKFVTRNLAVCVV